MTKPNPFDQPGDPWDATAIDGDDPFGDEDPFEPTRENFPSVDWLINRLVIVWPQEILEKLPGRKAGEYYDAIVCRVVVLDGPTDDNIPKVPYEIEQMRFNSDKFIQDMKHLIGSRKPKLARVGTGPSRYNKDVMARFFTAPSDEDRQTARRYLASQLHS